MGWEDLLGRVKSDAVGGSGVGAGQGAALIPAPILSLISRPDLEDGPIV